MVSVPWCERARQSPPDSASCGIHQAPQQRAALLEERLGIRRLGAGAQAADQIDVRFADQGAHQHRAAEQTLGERSAVTFRREGMADGHGSKRELHGVTHRVIPDRIEAGSFVIAGALSGGEISVKGARSAHLEAFLSKLKEAGLTLSADENGIKVKGDGKLKSVDVTTLPYPGFPTDLQAQMMVLMAVADGVSVVTETIFENRFMHAQELDRMGADIRLEGNRAVVRGVKELSGAPVMASDLRASVALILAGLVAKGTTEVSRVYHLDRGYERIEHKLAKLGARIERVKA